MRVVATEEMEQVKAGVPKPYRKPNLNKGPVLAKVTSAASQISGISQDTNPE